MTPFQAEHWYSLAKAIHRGDLKDLGICHGCFGIVPAEKEVKAPSPCPHCGHYDANEWEMVEDPLNEDGLEEVTAWR